jgi:2-amino-4-hydroxy-6-hydroxymethyldihydropteridine diphosphokinase
VAEPAVPGVTLAVLGLGSNLPLRERWLDLAAAVIGLAPATILRATPRWNTIPRGAPPQPDYLNQLLLVRGPWEGRGWLELARRAEAAAGRRRMVSKGPRTLDVDVVLVEGEASPGPELRLPHPALLERPHLLAGAAALVPLWTLPDGPMTLAELAAERLRGSWRRPVALEG